MDSDMTVSKSTDIELQHNVLSSILPHVNGLISSFNLPRSVIASDEEISYAWGELPREIRRIPPELRNELIFRMCVATSVGLFDGAINYIWNAVIINLRAQMVNFGLGLIAQTLNKKFEENDLFDLRDSELLDLSLKHEILTEEGYFFLNQCRDIRNNFSTAHPSIAQIDDRELINFVSRCCKYGITSDYNLRGIKIDDFIQSIRGGRLDDIQIDTLVSKLSNTFSAQRVLLYPMLFGLYCDPNSNETTRINALKICNKSVTFFDDKIKSVIIDQHSKYLLKSQEERLIASRTFFEKMGMLNLLNEHEQHSIIKTACNNLMQTHLAYNNFYNEPLFAERLQELVDSIKMPDTVKEEFSITVSTCFIGNQYGVCNAALDYYENMIKNFSPREISFLLGLPNSHTLVGDRIKTYSNCKARYFLALGLIDNESLTPQQKTIYEKIMKKQSLIMEINQ
jgi:hypothetical protein